MGSDLYLKNIFEVNNIENTKDSVDYPKMKRAEDEFTDVVDYLSNDKHIKNPDILSLMNLFYQLVGSKVTPVAMTDGVSTLGFYCEKRNGNSLGVVFMPTLWSDMLRETPFVQMGAMVFVASQAKDYWNNKFGVDDKQIILDRACAFEAEFLHYLLCQTDRKFEPTDYQKQILSKFPDGITSCSSVYEGRCYDANFPPFPIA